MTYYKKQPVLDEKEQIMFDKYLEEQYAKDLDLAERIAVKGYGDREGIKPLIKAVFDKLATPRVFLIDEWRKLSPEERTAYYPKDYQDRAKHEAEEISKKAAEMLSQ